MCSFNKPGTGFKVDYEFSNDSPNSNFQNNYDKDKYIKNETVFRFGDIVYYSIHPTCPEDEKYIIVDVCRVCSLIYENFNTAVKALYTDMTIWYNQFKYILDIEKRDKQYNLTYGYLTSVFGIGETLYVEIKNDIVDNVDIILSSPEVFKHFELLTC